MSSKTAKQSSRTAAWRISFWGALTFAAGAALAFGFLQRFLANDLQRRADAWLTGELGVLAEVAQHTPHDQLHDVVIREVAELASREAPRVAEEPDSWDRTVFFLMTTSSDRLVLHTGAGDPETNIRTILDNNIPAGAARSIVLQGLPVPFRVARGDLSNGSHIYLGLSTRYQSTVLRRLRLQFLAIWCLMILLGGGIVFATTRRMLQRVQAVSDTAAKIGRDNFATRVPVSEQNDEISQLSLTFNEMLDRIQAAVQQLHTMTDAIAHDVRSPITAIRGKLELALTSQDDQAKDEVLASTIDELDRLSALLSMSLDVSEASAKALRLHRQSVDMHTLAESTVDLYEPLFAEAGILLRMESDGPVRVYADSALLQRAVINLFENEVKHLPPASEVTVRVFEERDDCILQIEDNGPGFPQDLLPDLFQPYVRGKNSQGRGLGLAFVAAVVRSHGGRVFAHNQTGGGVLITLHLPLEEMNDSSSSGRAQVISTA